MKRVLLVVALLAGTIALPVVITGCQSKESKSAESKSAYTCANCGGSFDKPGKCPNGCSLEKRCQHCGNAASKCACAPMK